MWRTKVSHVLRFFLVAFCSHLFRLPGSGGSSPLLSSPPFIGKKRIATSKPVRQRGPALWSAARRPTQNTRKNGKDTQVSSDNSTVSLSCSKAKPRHQCVTGNSAMKWEWGVERSGEGTSDKSSSPRGKCVFHTAFGPLRAGSTQLSLVPLQSAQVFRLLLKTSVERNSKELCFYFWGSSVSSRAERICEKPSRSCASGSDKFHGWTSGAGALIKKMRQNCSPRRGQRGPAFGAEEQALRVIASRPFG